MTTDLDHRTRREHVTITAEQSAWFAETFDALVANVGLAVLGKDHVVRLALTAMLAEGHLLLEDAPGTGKTSLAKAIAATVQGTHSRIQFTPDLLPSDVTGVTIYDQGSRTFEFHPGPVFASVVLADEINRASPKTQSALLEVMEESRVTVDKVSHPVGRPFMVIATQNPIEQAGTYRLPEAQLDRFLIKTSLGYPDHESMVEILSGSAARDRTARLTAQITTEAVGDMAILASTVHTDTAVLDYVARLAAATRADAQTVVGVSVRGAIALVRCAKVWAASQGRGYVLPDDIKLLAEPVLAHRFVLDTEAEFAGVTATQVLGRILADTSPPAGRIG
jgi:MoxR-like ATPase